MSVHRRDNGSVTITDSDGDRAVLEAPDSTYRIYLRAQESGVYLSADDRRALGAFLLDGLEAGQ